jgi:hypothetical protein
MKRGRKGKRREIETEQEKKLEKEYYFSVV